MVQRQIHMATPRNARMATNPRQTAYSVSSPASNPVDSFELTTDPEGIHVDPRRRYLRIGMNAQMYRRRPCRHQSHPR